MSIYLESFNKMANYSINSFLNYKSSGIYSNIKLGLFDNKVSYDSADLFGFYWKDNAYLDINIDRKCSLWCLSGSAYEDYNDPFIILKWNGNEFKNSGIIENPRSIKKETWTKTINILPKGRYKFISNCRFDSEWYLEDINKFKYLIKQDNKYYSIKQEYYKNNKFIPLEINELNKDNINKYSFDDIDSLLLRVYNDYSKTNMYPINIFNKCKLLIFKI